MLYGATQETYEYLERVKCMARSPLSRREVDVSWWKLTRLLLIVLNINDTVCVVVHTF